MEFRVLGPLSVTRAGLPVYLDHGHKPRLLLAMLLARSPQVVSVDELLAGLWGERPPRSARPNIQQYVHRLRLSLGAEVIRRDSGGYALAVPDEELDAARFRALAARASTELSSGDTQAANLSLSSALDEWKGPAFAGFRDCDLVADEAARLDQHRLLVQEQWSETELELGRHRQLIESLSELVESHPYRETFRGQLMLALHRSGRRADALELYRKTRLMLVEELGVEPDESLRQLHHAILRGTPDVTERAPAPTPDRVSTPNQLPPLFAPFVGRTAERARIVDALLTRQATSPVVLAISGMGGLGKTSIAVWAAHSVLGSFPDGCVFADLRGDDNNPASPHAVLGAFLRAVGVLGADIPQSRTERLGMYRSVTANRRLLIVLDNAHTEAQVRPLIPAGPQCGVIITSRRSLSALDLTYAVDLDPLSESDSAELLRAGVPTAALRDAKGINELLRWCGGLPLAIRIVAGRLSSRNAPDPARLTRILRDATDPIDEMHLGDLNVRGSFMLSYRRLSPAAAALLGHLARLRLPHFAVPTCVPLVGKGYDGAADALAELADANLVSNQRDTRTARYRMHDLVRSFAAVEAARDSDDDYSVALNRLADLYIATVRATRPYTPSGPDEHLRINVPPVKPFPDETAALGWLDDEVDNVVAALSAFAGAALHTETCQLAYLLRPYLRLRYRFDDRREVGATGLASARELGDPLAVAHGLESLASAYQDETPADPLIPEYYHDALRMFRELGDDIGTATCEEQLGMYHQQTGQLDVAEQHHRRAFEIEAYAKDPVYSSRTHLNLGTLYGRQQRYEDAIAEFRIALALAESVGDIYQASFAHHNLAFAFNLLGHKALAQQHVEVEIEIAGYIRNALREARGWHLLGQILEGHDRTRAKGAFARAMELYDQVGRDHQAQEARVLMRNLS